MKKHFSVIFSWLVAAVIGTSVSNLFLVLNESVGYVNGMRIDYLMPKFYLSDIAVLTTIIFALTNTQIRKKLWNLLTSHTLVGLLSLVIFTFSAIFSKVPEAGVFIGIKLLEMSLLLAVIVLAKKFLHKNILLYGIYFALITQTLFAAGQFNAQHSLTPYNFFGETQFTGSTIGLAHAELLGGEKILSYGTTAHPNILAGAVVLLSIAALSLQKKYRWLILLNMTLILFLTQSVSALLSAIVGLTLQQYPNLTNLQKKNIIFACVVLLCLTPIFIFIGSQIFPNSFSLTRRNELDIAATNMLVEKPIFGVGLGNFTANLESYVTNKEFVRFLQPAHNVLVLWSAETGIIGLLLIVLIFMKLKLQRVPLLVTALIPIAALDHYLLTIQTGLLVAILFIGVTINSQINSKDHYGT